jgi:acyl carrier protein
MDKSVMEQNATSDSDQRVREALARIFELPVSEVTNLSMGLHPRWDSMGHMQLIMEIEKEFGLRFPTYEIAELLSTDAIIKAVARHSQE